MARPPTKLLAELLESSFKADELRGFVADLDGGDALLHDLTEGASLKKLAREVVDGAERHGLLDATFFAELRKVRRKRIPEIDKIADRFTHRPEAPTAAPAPTDDTPAPAPAGFQLPFERKPGIVGREDALTTLDRLLREERRIEVAISGVGGLGKTQLAIEYAYRHRDDFPGGIVWLTADAPWSLQLQQIAVRAGWVSERAEMGAKLAAGEDNLPRLRDALLIVDNVLDLADVEKILPPTTRAQRLYTSIPPLPRPSVPLTLLTHEDAVRLVCAVSGRPDSDDVRALARRLDGWPLALELASAYLALSADVSVADYLALMDARGGDAVPHDATAASALGTRHTPDLRATLRASAPILHQHPGLAAILDVLAWSGPAPMSRGLLAAVLDRPEVELIEDLALGVRLQLLRFEGGRHRIHRFLHVVLRRDATTPVEVVEARIRRGFAWMTARRQEYEDLTVYEAELPHVTAWGAEAKALGWDEGVAVTRWLEAYLPYQLGEAVRVRALLHAAAVAMDAAGDVPPLFRLRLLMDLCWAHQTLDDDLRALAYLRAAQEAATRLIELPDEERLRLLRMEADLLAAKKDGQDEALVVARAAWGDYARPRQSLSIQLSLAVSLVTCLHLHGRLEEARNVILEARGVAQALAPEGHWELCFLLSVAASVERAAGHHDLAQSLAREAVAMARAVAPRDRRLTTNVLWHLASTLTPLSAPGTSPSRTPQRRAHAQERLDAAAEAAAISIDIFRWQSPKTIKVAIEHALAAWDLGWLANDGTLQIRALRILDEALRNGARTLPAWQDVSELRDHLASQKIPGFRTPPRPVP